MDVFILGSSTADQDMEQRDLIKDQIEQLGKVLARILSDILGLAPNSSVAQGIEMVNEQLQSELDINIEEILTRNKAELTEYLRNRIMTAGHLETLSEYLKEVGIAKAKINKSETESYLNKAIELLDIADEITKTASFDRIYMKKTSKNCCETLHQISRI